MGLTLHPFPTMRKSHESDNTLSQAPTHLLPMPVEREGNRKEKE